MSVALLLQTYGRLLRFTVPLALSFPCSAAVATPQLQQPSALLWDLGQVLGLGVVLEKLHQSGFSSAKAKTLLRAPTVQCERSSVLGDRGPKGLQAEAKPLGVAGGERPEAAEKNRLALLGSLGQ